MIKIIIAFFIIDAVFLYLIILGANKNIADDEENLKEEEKTNLQKRRKVM